MRRQNPPQASLDQALALERYLNPVQLGMVYVICATVGFVIITILFAILASGYLVKPTNAIAMVFAILALSPWALALIEFLRRPDDLLSTFFRSLANSRRQPLSVVDDRCAFKVLLMTGEPLCVNLAFYYPAKNHTQQVQERIFAHVRIALDHYISFLNDPPTDSEVLDTVDRALDSIASEFDIPVLYCAVRDQHKIRDAYSRLDDVLTPSEYLGLATGTLG